MARALLFAGPMMPHGPSRTKTWITLACLAAGAHAGFAAHELLDREVADCDDSEVRMAVVSVAARPSSRGPVWCTDPDRCSIDFALLEREPMPFPRGLRLEPEGGGLRLDGARGMVTRLGLRNGDVLLAIDEHPLRDGSDLTALQIGIDHGGFVLTYRRGEHEHHKHIAFLH